METKIITDYDVIYVITDDIGNFETFWDIAITNTKKENDK